MTDGSKASIARCLIAAVLFGAATPLSKSLLGELGPFTLAGLLYLGSGLAALPAALRRLPTKLLGDRRNLVRLGGAVGFGGVLAPAFLLLGLSRASAGSVSLWLNIEPIATTLLAWAIFREHMTRRAWVAVALIVGAGALLALPWGNAPLTAAGLVALACVCWGLDNNLTALIDAFTPAQTTAIKGLVAGSINLWLGLQLEAGPGSPKLAVYALSIGAVCFGLSLILYITGSQQLGAGRSQLIFATAPFCGLVLSWTALSEPVLWTQIAAAGLAVLAVRLLLAERHGHPHTHEAVTHLHPHRHDDGHHDHQHAGIAAGVWHTHEHMHEPVTHTHPHNPDLHHRHTH